MSSFEQILPSSNLLSISCLARLGAKPTFQVLLERRCFHSSIRAFSFWDVLSYCPFALLCFPSSCSVELTLSTLCSRINIPCSCQGAALAHLDNHLTIMLFGPMTLSFLLLASASVALANNSLYGAEITLPCLAGPARSSFSAQPAPFCKLLRWSRQHQQVCHFFLFALFLLYFSLLRLLPSSSHSLTYQAETIFSLLLFFDQTSGSQVSHFLQVITRPVSGPHGMRRLSHPQFCVISLLSSLAFTLLFSRTGDVRSHQNSLSHKSSQNPLKNMCFLVAHVVSNVVFAAMDTAYSPFAFWRLVFSVQSLVLTLDSCTSIRAF